MSTPNQRANDQSPDVKCVETQGPWPFVTRRVYQDSDQAKHIWSSRHHRKGLLPSVTREAKEVAVRLSSCLWMPESSNWWIGVVFAIGSLLFALASVLSLWPNLAAAWSLDSTGINAIFFAGSIPFTIAAYLQLFQAANVGEFLPDQARLTQRPKLFGWRPHDVGWLSSALQFVGTILFNVNTFDAMIPALDWLQQDLEIWAPDIVGSVLFLASGYLAFIETCHALWAWNPKNISWWVTFINLLGCVGFMISAVFAFVPPGLPNVDAVTLSVAFTLLGAIGFLVGSLLMLPETAAATES
jgi:hypothetical protein